jgi:hypothetical protein
MKGRISAINPVAASREMRTVREVFRGVVNHQARRR